MFNFIKSIFKSKKYNKRNDRIWKSYKLDNNKLISINRILCQLMLLDDLEEEGIYCLDPTKTLLIFCHTYGGDTYALRNLDIATNTEQENIIIDTVIRLKDKNLKSDYCRYNEIYKFVEVYGVDSNSLRVKRTILRRMKGGKSHSASWSVGSHSLENLKNLEA